MCFAGVTATTLRCGKGTGNSSKAVITTGSSTYRKILAEQQNLAAKYPGRGRAVEERTGKVGSADEATALAVSARLQATGMWMESS